MKTIYKYPLNIVDSQQLELPDDAYIMSVAKDPQGKVCAWVMLDTQKQTTIRTLLVIGTGHPVPDRTIFIGTVIDGPFVWHVFESLVRDI